MLYQNKNDFNLVNAIFLWLIIFFSLGFISANVLILFSGIKIGSYPNPLEPFGSKLTVPLILPENIIESTWSGIVSRSRNSSQIFEKINDNIYVAGTYNGSGIGVGTLFGEQIAIKCVGEKSKEIEIIETRKKPNLLPPEPFLSIGAKAKLFYERLRAKSEI